MFVISEANPSGYRSTRTETNNIRDIYDIILNITGSESEAKWAVETAGEMGFGAQYERARYLLECVRK